MFDASSFAPAFDLAAVCSSQYLPAASVKGQAHQPGLAQESQSD